MCGYCYADAKPSKRAMSWEDFTTITKGLKTLRKRFSGLDIFGENFQISSPDHFPENFRNLFDFRTLTKVPTIREMGTFSIPECLDLEHKRLLEAVNQAILQKTCLKTVLQNYFEGRYA